MIVIDNISFTYRAQERVLKNVSLKIPFGDFVAIIGPNGSGKSTFAKILAGILKPKEGSLLYNSQTIEKFSSKIGYVPQRAQVDSQFPATVKELLETQQVGKGTITCSKLGVSQLLEKQFSKLSGGQQQKVLIELALQKNPSVLILDEPVSGVDIASQKEFYALLKHLHEHHKLTIFFVTHDLGMIPKSTKHILHFTNQSCVYAPITDAQKIIKKMFQGFDLVQTELKK